MFYRDNYTLNMLRVEIARRQAIINDEKIAIAALREVAAKYELEPAMPVESKLCARGECRQPIPPARARRRNVRYCSNECQYATQAHVAVIKYHQRA
jgi:hypothetical protein